MAKKRRKKEVEAEKYEFKPPDFDERQFLIDEMKATKRVILTVAYAGLFGALAAGATSAVDAPSFGLLIMILGLISLKYVFPLMGIDLSKFTKRTWLESGAWFFFTFMALWILMYNPPFSDHAGPDIEEISVSVNVEGSGWLQFDYIFESEAGAHTWSEVNGTSLASALQGLNNTEINITARVADASGLTGNPRIAIGVRSPVEMTLVDDYLYTYSIASFDSSYLKADYLFTFSIVAEDGNGTSTTFELDSHAEIPLD